MNIKNHFTLIPIVAISVILGVSIYYFYRTIDSIGKKLQNLDDNYKTLTNRFNDIEQKNRLLSEYNKNKKRNDLENNENDEEQSINETGEQPVSDVDGEELEDLEMPDELSLDEISKIEEIMEQEDNNLRVPVTNSNDEEVCQQNAQQNAENDDDDDDNDNLDEINMENIGLPDNLSDESETELSEQDGEKEEQEQPQQEQEQPQQTENSSNNVMEQMMEQNKPKRSLIPPKKLGLARNFKEGHQAEDDNGDTWEVVSTKRGTKRWTRLD